MAQHDQSGDLKPLVVPRYLPILGVTLAVVLSVACAGSYVYERIGLWLIVSDQIPRKVDVLFCFGGDKQRVLFAAEILKQHPSTALLVGCPQHDSCHDALNQAGLQDSQVIFFDNCTNTVDEVLFLKKWIGSRALKGRADSIPVVAMISSPWHMRRIALIAELVGLRPLAKLVMVPVPLSCYDLPANAFQKWYETPEVRKRVFREAMKIGLTYVR